MRYFFNFYNTFLPPKALQNSSKIRAKHPQRPTQISLKIPPKTPPDNRFKQLNYNLFNRYLGLRDVPTCF